MDYLALKIGKINHIRVNYSYGSDTGCCKIQCCGRSKSAGSDNDSDGELNVDLKNDAEVKK